MPLVLLVAFIVVPLIELAVIGQVSQAIGLSWTLVALLVVSVAGAWLVRREGSRAWQRLRATLGAGRMPTDEVLSGALVLVGGALLLTPGFVTDAVGLALVVPPTRRLIAAAVKSQVGRRVSIATFGGGLIGDRLGGVTGGQRARPRRDHPGDGQVVDVEVVDVRRDDDVVHRRDTSSD